MNRTAISRRRKPLSLRSAGFELLEPRSLLSAVAPSLWPSPLPAVGTTSISGYTPKQINKAYGFDVFGPNRGAGQMIAITTAYHDPTIKHDLAVFDRAFGLPA